MGGWDDGMGRSRGPGLRRPLPWPTGAARLPRTCRRPPNGNAERHGPALGGNLRPGERACRRTSSTGVAMQDRIIGTRRQKRAYPTNRLRSRGS